MNTNVSALVEHLQAVGSSDDERTIPGSNMTACLYLGDLTQGDSYGYVDMEQVAAEAKGALGAILTDNGEGGISVELFPSMGAARKRWNEMTAEVVVAMAA